MKKTVHNLNFNLKLVKNIEENTVATTRVFFFIKLEKRFAEERADLAIISASKFSNLGT